jgi:hypothetical protein
MGEFEDFRDRVFALYSDGQYEGLHALLDGAVERFPNGRSRITYWQACVDSLLGEPRRALERLSRGADEGMFWPENSLHTDPDLAAARALAGYGQMMKAVRRSAERANSNRPGKPEVLLFAPESGPVRGLLIGLHMYARSAAESVPHWDAGTDQALVMLGEEAAEADVVGRHVPSLEHHHSP